MGYFTSVSSLTVLWLMLAAGVGVVSLPAVKPYSGPGDDCSCIPYNHFCSLEVLPLTVVGAYSFAPYICPLRTRLCCLETPPEINQIEYEEPLILANTDSLFFKDPASQFHRARQLLYNSDVQVTHDKPETTANEEIQFEDTHRHKAGNMAEDVKLSDVQEVEGQFLDTIVNQENVHDEEKQISEKYVNYGLGDSVILEDGASHTATETLETSLGFSEGEKMYLTTLMQESSHMTERDMALIQDDTQAVMVVHGTSHITDTLRTSTEDNSAFHDSLMEGKNKETSEGTDVDDSAITHAFSEGGTSSQMATIHDSSTLMTTVYPVDAMQSFHNETPERTDGAEPSPTVTRDNDSVLYVFATTETSLQNDSVSRPLVSSPGGSAVTMNTDNDAKNVDSLMIDSDIKELHGEQSFPGFYNFTSSSSRTTQIPPKVNGNKSTTQVVYDYTVTPDPSITDKVDYAKIVELAEAIISQNHKTLSDLQYSGSTTQPGQSTTVIHYVAVNEKAVEKYSDLHKQLSIQGLEGIYSEAISTVSQEVKNFHHEKSRDPTHEHEQEVLFTQLDHGNNCSRNQCGNNTIVAQEPNLVNQSSVSVNPSSASHTDRPETLSYLENYTNEFFETSLVFDPPTTANLIIGSDTTIPSSTDEPALWYWFFP